MIDWTSKLDPFGRYIITELGGDPDSLSTSENIITISLRDETFVETYGEIKGFNKSSMARVASVCQMVVFDHCNGPEQDGERKAMRRHWYAWFKTTFAQPFSEQLGEDIQGERWGRNWFALLSTTYSHFVDRLGLTYHDLWVNDASRMMKGLYGRLFNECNIVICVEKDSLFDDFEPAAKAIGATAIYSGKGKSSKAGIEKLLKTTFYWQPDQQHDPFDAQDPLIVLTISDFDFDGESVIDPTFAAQLGRYTNHVVSARVGIQPGAFRIVTGRTWQDAVETNDAYAVKMKNSGYLKWAAEKALFWHKCRECGNAFVEQGADLCDEKTGKRFCFVKCPECGSSAEFLFVDKDTTAYGFEVEAMFTRDYYGLIVKALLTVLDFDYLVSKLRDECRADPRQAIVPAVQQILEENASYKKLLQEFERLEIIKSEFEDRAKNGLEAQAVSMVGQWRNEEEDPTPDDFEAYVKGVQGYVSVWRPFAQALRTKKLTAWVFKTCQDTIEKFKEETIKW